MRDYYIFLKSNFRPVYFGWLLTFFSSFGQTFLVSMYVPSILREFDLSRAAFGGYYSAATLAASLFLLKVGHVIDHKPVRPFTVKTVLLLSASCILLAGAVHPAMIIIALTGMRLGGQSLLSHISSSVMSRYFDRDRGKALSLSSLGFSSGEIIFPVIVGALIAFSGWRSTLLYTGVFIAAALIPMLKKIDIEAMDVNQENEKDVIPPGKLSLYMGIMKRKNFWLIVFPTFFFSLTLTGFFFYQYTLAEERMWPVEWYAACFAGFGIAKLASIIFGGVLIDKFSGVKLFPFFVIPSLPGFLVLAYVTHRFSPLIFLPLIGITVGLSGVITSAAIAEVYGVVDIGKIRSLFTVFMVVGAAMGPILYGVLLDSGYSFAFIALASAAVIVAMSVTNSMLDREEAPGGC